MLSKSLGVVLVAEDDQFIQDLIRRHLSSIGIEVFFASDGIEAVKKYSVLMESGKRPDIVIMDIGLPFKDGIEATKEILQIDEDAIIFGFTAFYGTEKAKKLLDAGAKLIIPRSIGFEKFKEIIEEYLVGRMVVR
ncbi:MAG: response regulator [Thermoplasmata archaeon]|nr:MAG: response regulator [Thermoplasmata archaeon]HDN95495.1 response regulator [Thermoplasmatales archaeon]